MEEQVYDYSCGIAIGLVGFVTHETTIFYKSLKMLRKGVFFFVYKYWEKR